MRVWRCGRWLFPTISNGQNVFNKFCALSPTSRSSDFIMVLSPIRDYFFPQDPESPPLFRATSERYSARLSVDIYPDKPGFGEDRWITSEDANIEHLLDIFANSDCAWGACLHFMGYLYWHKPQRTVLEQETEGLPDDRPFRSGCTSELSRSFERVGNHPEQERPLAHTLSLERDRGDYLRATRASRFTNSSVTQ